MKAILLAAALAVAPVVVAAQPGLLCGPRAEVVERLHSKYGETRRGFGVQGASVVVEVYASDATDTWTIILTTPDGRACLVAAGQKWTPDSETLGPKT